MDFPYEVNDTYRGVSDDLHYVCIAGRFIVVEKTSGIHCPEEPIEVLLAL